MVMVILFFIAWSMIASLALIRLYNKNTKIEILNEKIRSQNREAEKLRDEISQEIAEKTAELFELKEAALVQGNMIKSLKETTEQMRRDAENRAENAYQARVSELELQYRKKEKELEEKLHIALDKTNLQVNKEEEKLQTLKAKQLAYIQAQQRQLEMEAKKDFYRLCIGKNDQGDISLLREMQNRFVRKEVIDKLIWEVYFKKPYDTLMSRLSLDQGKKCGIYKITNLTTGQVYIGQSVDIKERFRTHIKSALSSAPASNKLYQAMKEYGPEDFTFEILEEISRDKLNEREAYWIDFYKTREFGLNVTRGNGV